MPHVVLEGKITIDECAAHHAPFVFRDAALVANHFRLASGCSYGSTNIEEFLIR